MGRKRKKNEMKSNGSKYGSEKRKKNEWKYGLKRYGNN